MPKKFKGDAWSVLISDMEDDEEYTSFSGRLWGRSTSA